MKVLRQASSLQAELNRRRREGRTGFTVGFVPTMGALHRGHAELIRHARRASDLVVVSIFVNPLQFGPTEDLARYPRTLETDVRLCEQTGADIVFAPEAKSFLKMKSLKPVRAAVSLKKVLCGPLRPGHFDGVTTIVAHFFRIVRPDLAFFGLKDYQQYLVIDEMTKRVLGGKPHIVPVPTVREKNGLAMSSRNRYLKPAEKKAAPLFHKALDAARRRIASGKVTAAEVERFLHQRMAASGFFKIQYLKVYDARTLKPIRGVLRAGENRIVIAGAVFLGGTRLIDNVLV